MINALLFALWRLVASPSSRKANFPKLANPWPFFSCMGKSIGLTNKRSIDLDTVRIEHFDHVLFIVDAYVGQLLPILRLDFNHFLQVQLSKMFHKNFESLPVSKETFAQKENQKEPK